MWIRIKLNILNKNTKININVKIEYVHQYKHIMCRWNYDTTVFCKIVHSEFIWAQFEVLKLHRIISIAESRYKLI